MFRALEHEGVAAETLYHLLVPGDRRMTSDQRIRAFAACAVVALTFKAQRNAADAMTALANSLRRHR